MIRTSVTRLLPLGLGLALVLPSSGCILPAHHRAATAVNATIGGFGLIGIVGPSFGDSSGRGLDLTPVIREAGASLLVLALVGEALTMFVTPDPDDDAVTPAGGSGSGSVRSAWDPRAWDRQPPVRQPPVPRARPRCDRDDREAIGDVIRESKRSQLRSAKRLSAR